MKNEHELWISAEKINFKKILEDLKDFVISVSFSENGQGSRAMYKYGGKIFIIEEHIQNEAKYILKTVKDGFK